MRMQQPPLGCLLGSTYGSSSGALQKSRAVVYLLISTQSGGCDGVEVLLSEGSSTMLSLDAVSLSLGANLSRLPLGSGQRYAPCNVSTIPGYCVAADCEIMMRNKKLLEGSVLHGTRSMCTQVESDTAVLMYCHSLLICSALSPQFAACATVC